MIAKTPGHVGRIGCFLALLSVAASLSADDIPNPSRRPDADEAAAKDARQAVRQAIARYRSARTKPKQQAAALKQLAGLDEEGISAAKDLLNKELQPAETAIRLAKKPSKLDASIEKLRKTLTDLRHDPDLSKEQLHDIGLPALDELNRECRERAATTAAQTAKKARAAESLRQLISVLKSLQDPTLPDAPSPFQDVLLKAEGVLNQLSSPEEEQARAVLAENQAMASQFPADLRSGMDAVNAVRMTCGLLPLLYDAKLCTAAHGHSRDMLVNDFFSHESPVEGKKTPWDRAKLAGTTASGENIYMGSNVSIDAIKAWFLSPGHHKNMLSESPRRQGLGHEGKYWTQMFGLAEVAGDAKHR